MRTAKVKRTTSRDRVMRNLSCRRVQVDELWGFIGCKQRNVTEKIAQRIPGAGDV